MPLLSAVDLHKTYTSGDSHVSALSGVSLTIEAGEFIALMGPSGCGKSTLLHLCGAMDRPSSGSITFEGRNLSSLTDDELTQINGNREQLEGRIQARYGYARDQVRKEVDDWLRRQ